MIKRGIRSAPEIAYAIEEKLAQLILGKSNLDIKKWKTARYLPTAYDTVSSGLWAADTAPNSLAPSPRLWRTGRVSGKQLLFAHGE